MDAIVHRSQDQEERRKKILQYQREITLLESDKKRLASQFAVAQRELHRLQRQEELIHLQKEEVQKDLEKVERRLRTIENEITLLRKKLGMVR